MADTTLRYIKMLDSVPTQPRKITAQEVRARLADAGYVISARSVERDLEKLAAVFPINKDDRNRPYGWSWFRDAARVDIQPIDAVSALTLMLARDHLVPLLPASVIKVLAPRFEAAARLLADTGHDIGRLPERIRVKSRGQRLALPVVDHTLLESLYSALQASQQIHLSYAARKHAGKARDYVADPLGLVFIDGVIYLVCCLYGNQASGNAQQETGRIAHLPVHRIKSISLTTTAALLPKDFDLDTFVADHFDYPVGSKPLKLVFRMERSTAAHLLERPLASNQHIEDASPEASATDFITVRATVADTQQLRWWLLGFGDKVDVLEPATLRQEFATIAATLHHRYQHS